jgi:rubredoxin
MSEFKKYVCVVCGYIYDEEQGDPENGVAPGTRWDDVPEDWTCDDCGASKRDFELMAL